SSAPLWRHPVVLIFAAAAMSCLIVLVPHVGIVHNGARRWLPLGPVGVQPSELAKWATVIFLAWWLSTRRVDHFFRGVVLTLIPIGAICLLIVIQDFGTAALIAICAVTMMLAGRVKIRHLLIVAPPALLAAFAFVPHVPY